jgi:hypothetical protein
MGWRNLNFEYFSLFKSRFGREPRVWTVSEIHDLWMRSKSRSIKKRKEFTDYLHWIVENVKPNDGKMWKLFYSDTSFYLIEKINPRDRVYEHYEDQSPISFGIGHIKSDRNSKIDSIIKYSSTIEIGKKLKSLENKTSHLDWKVKSHLDRIIGTKIPRMSGIYGDMDRFIRINNRLYLYKFTIRTGESKIITEIKENEIIEL